MQKKSNNWLFSSPIVLTLLAGLAFGAYKLFGSGLSWFSGAVGSTLEKANNQILDAANQQPTLPATK